MALQDQAVAVRPGADTVNLEVILELSNGITVRRFRQSDVASLVRHGERTFKLHRPLQTYFACLEHSRHTGMA